MHLGLRVTRFESKFDLPVKSYSDSCEPAGSIQAAPLVDLQSDWDSLGSDLEECAVVGQSGSRREV